VDALIAWPSIDDDSCVYENCILNVEGFSKLGINIYPNPTTGKVYIELDKSTNNSQNTISIFDLAGKILFQSKFNHNRAELNLSNFAKGMYLIEIKNKKNISERNIQKLMVE